MKIGKISPTIWNRSVKKKVHMDQTDGSFSWADVCVCGGHAGIGYYAVLGAAGELAARKIQAEGISVRILFPEETEEEFLADVCGEIQKGCECIKAKLTSLSAEGTAAVHTRMLYVRDHVRQNVEQILYFSRLGAAHKDCYFEPILILETCREAVEDNLSLLEEAQFSVTYSGNDCNVISNKKGFMFILGQIISNSVKYAVKDTAPAIQFSVTDNPESGQITLSVSDNGTGIPASDLPFVFDKGFTGDAGSFLSRSTGMGLYLVQKMAKDLAIDLQITSQLSCGTTFILMFPKVQYPVRRFDDATADSYANTKEK